MLKLTQQTDTRIMLKLTQDKLFFHMKQLQNLV